MSLSDIAAELAKDNPSFRRIDQWMEQIRPNTDCRALALTLILLDRMSSDLDLPPTLDGQRLGTVMIGSSGGDNLAGLERAKLLLGYYVEDDVVSVMQQIAPLFRDPTEYSVTLTSLFTIWRSILRHDIGIHRVT